MYRQILNFWFDEASPAQWWQKDAAFDRMVAERFGEVHTQAARGELFDWRSTAAGRLAEVIVLDQFSRNMFRDSAAAFACDGMALVLAQEAIAAGAEQALRPVERSFLYMPFMHSESLRIHEVAVQLFERNGIPDDLDFELRHKAIIERFGRYPHRNALLGRESTPDEVDFLKRPGSRF
ncbi:MAG: hypothetical protein AzoDbin1_01299 [Azoarcus sp.]|uniref:Uncharacterized conserved protein, DUF924 family n=1 Tax=Aromatoleum tolulyticum TaxID=34027 RepID=A0A1N6SYN3_9RHOO|nr:DUF924 family protein [Aromatoleum tolulyticum]MCK9984827.1 hypothetical protein [Azoarcus sp.]SIQ46203.1 Uncharacterized conserved protein, DUF924 family [Aromatoleum tolulyticum]